MARTPVPEVESSAATVVGPLRDSFLRHAAAENRSPCCQGDGMVLLIHGARTVNRANERGHAACLMQGASVGFYRAHDSRSLAHGKCSHLSQRHVVRLRPCELFGRGLFLWHIPEDQQAQESPLVGRYREVGFEPQSSPEHLFCEDPLLVPLVAIHWGAPRAHCEWIACRGHVANGRSP